MRLFIAINLPDEVRRGLDAVVAPLRPQIPSVRWVAPERQHITLKFLGECTPERTTEVSAALTAVAMATPSLSCTFSGAGVFPNFRRPRVVWIGVQQPLFAKVAFEIERALSKLGVPAEARPFAPHLTVGRVDGELGEAELAVLVGWVAQVGQIAQLHVRSLDLMQSELGPGGPTYTLVSLAPLGPHHS
ncbi:MAG: RNA 2',3'-cyclic phosphodiesterase [Gemmatimonadaceae bacterium]